MGGMRHLAIDDGRQITLQFQQRSKPFHSQRLVAMLRPLLAGDDGKAASAAMTKT